MNAKTVRAEEGTKLELMGDAIRIILRCEDTGGNLTLVQQRSLPGAGIPLHINTREDEVFQVLEGQVEFEVGEQKVTANPGTVVHVPKHLPHSFRIVGTGAALIQIMMLPGGLEKMIEEIIELPNHRRGKESQRSVIGMGLGFYIISQRLPPNIPHGHRTKRWRCGNAPRNPEG